MKLSKLVTALVATTTIATAAQAANLVTNGDFSQSTYRANSQFGPGFGGQGVTGWTSAGFNLYFFGGTQTTTSAANQYGDPANYFRSNVVTDGVGGGNFVALDGDSTVSGALTQTITGLTAGKTYLLTFDWAAAQLINRTGAYTEKLQVSFGGQTFSTPTLSEASTAFSGWQTASFLFTPTTTSSVLSFLSVGTPNGLPPVALLDSVSLTAVPEPATWAMLIAGFALVGFASRRRYATTVAA